MAATRAEQDRFIGRWDIVIAMPGGEQPSWLEVRRSGFETLVGRFVGVAGSARPIARVDVDGERMRFSIPRQWEDGSGDLEVEGRLTGGRLEGTMRFPDGTPHEWSASRAPALRRTVEPTWGEPIDLLGGPDLAGWRIIGANTWSVAEGVLRNAGEGGNLVTERRFTDFRLRLDFRYPRGSNSGVYLRGRYEVQIADSPTADPADDLIGAIYGFHPPSVIAARPPGEWQTYEITLVGRMVTVVLNGTMVICDREIPGITGGALDSDEGAPGPIMLQGDHGPVEFRNIVLTPAM